MVSREAYLPGQVCAGPFWLTVVGLWAAVSLGGREVRADPVERFELSLASDRRSDRLRVELQMLFVVDPGERPLRGKKFVGQGEVFDLRAWGLRGDPLRVAAVGGVGLRRRIEFDLSAPMSAGDARAYRGVTLQFAQQTLARHRWRGQHIVLDWPGESQVPVQSTVYRLGPGLIAEGLPCTLEPTGWRRCVLDAPRELHLVRSASPARWAWVGAGVGVAMALLAAALRRRRDCMAARVAAPSVSPAETQPPSALSYRLNVPATVRPVARPAQLSPELMQRWRLEVAATVALTALPPMVLAAEVSLWGVRHSPALLLAATWVLSALAALTRRPDGVPRGWPTALLALAMSLWVAV